jgi:hypothetical protein
MGGPFWEPAPDGAEYGWSRPGRATESLLSSADVRMHTASTMEVPVMIQLYLTRDAERVIAAMGTWTTPWQPRSLKRFSITAW